MGLVLNYEDVSHLRLMENQMERNFEVSEKEIHLVEGVRKQNKKHFHGGCLRLGRSWQDLEFCG